MKKITATLLGLAMCASYGMSYGTAVAATVLSQNDLMLSQQAAVAQKKIIGPQVQVVFDKQAIQVGDEVSAKAIPVGFSGSSDKLYFTWYLKHKKDGNDVSAWKNNAAQLVALNSGTSSDSYEKTDNKYCYMQDYKTGLAYELQDMETEYYCNSGGTPSCVNDKTLDCSAQDPATPVKYACVKDGKPEKCEIKDIDNFSTQPICEDGHVAKCPVSGHSFFSSDSSDSSLCTAIGTDNAGETCTAAGENGMCKFKSKGTGDEGNQCQHLFEGVKVDNKTIDGLGADIFTWVYQEGDEIGVAVEGETAFPTQHSDNTRMVMWAFPRNTCKAMNDVEKSFYVSQGGAFNSGDALYSSSEAGILAIADFDVNDCLQDNLIDPRDTTGTNDLDVSLDYFPKAVEYDPLAAGDGDMVKVVANVNNIPDSSQYYFRWQVLASGDGTNTPAGDTWKDITSKVLSGDFQEGMGKTTFQFATNIKGSDFPNGKSGVQYVKIVANVSQSKEAVASARTGSGTTIIQLTPLGERVKVFATNIDGSGKLSVSDEQLCSADSEKEVCPVLGNQIVAVKLPNTQGKISSFTWKKGTQNLNCTSAMSAACKDNIQTNVTFVPVIDTEGETFDVTATVNESGIAKEITRSFYVVSPMAAILPANGDTWQKLLGHYKNLDGSVASDDLSTEVLQSNAGNTIVLKPVFYPQWLEQSKNVSMTWEVNGEQTVANESNMVTIATEANVPTSYNIDLAAEYMPAAETRQALNKFWGISPSITTEQTVNANVQVEVLLPGQENNAIGFAKDHPILASLTANLPERIMFLVKIILTMGLLLVVMSVLFAFMPEQVENKANIGR